MKDCIFNNIINYNILVVSKTSFIMGLWFVLYACLIGFLFNNFYLAMVISILGSLLIYLSNKFLPRIFTRYVVISYIIDVFCVLLLYYIYIVDFGLPYWMAGMDDYLLEKDAFRCVENGYFNVYDMINSGYSRDVLHNSKGYVILLSYLIRLGNILGGYHTLVPRIVNIFLLNLIGIILSKYLYVTECKNVDLKICKFYLFITLFPNMIYISAHIYRDIFNSFLVVLSFWVSYNIITVKKDKIRKILILSLILYVSFWIRAMSIIFELWIIFVLALVCKKYADGYYYKILFLIIVVAPIVIYFIEFGLRLEQYIYAYTLSISNNTSDFISQIFSLPLFPYGIVLRIILYLSLPFYYKIIFNPNIWFISLTNLCYVLISIGTIYIVSQYIYIYKSIKNALDITLIAICILFGITLTTFGYRHVVLLYPFLMIMIYKGRISLYNNMCSLRYKILGINIAIVFLTLFIVAFMLK